MRDRLFGPQVISLVTLTMFLGFTGGCGGDSETTTDAGPSDAIGDKGGADEGQGGDAADVPMGDAPSDGDEMVDCMGKPDGTACADGSICLKDVCVVSSCGDGYVNKALGEDCEDGNKIVGDGCSVCHFDCQTSKDCDDGEVCNGDETCDTSKAGKQMCTAGKPAADASACTLAAGAGTCKGGVCVAMGCGNKMKDPGEDCDDGNADDADGCTRKCKFTCTMDADCDDGDACTGAEKCDPATHVCTAGTPVTCKTETCTGTCDSATGMCVYPDADMDGVSCDTDCKDADPAVFPGGFECKDGKDNDCNADTADATAPSCECYVDTDKDGYAATTTGAVASAGSCPDGYTRRKPIDADTTDCAPKVASAHPAQREYFETGYCTKAFCPIDSRSFDYNCDMVETKFDATIAADTCAGFFLGKGCVNRSGWIGTVPDCGAKGTYRQCVASGSSCTGTDIAGYIQACH